VANHHETLTSGFARPLGGVNGNGAAVREAAVVDYLHRHETADLETSGVGEE
jgi:hypothetical protein